MSCLNWLTSDSAHGPAREHRARTSSRCIGSRRGGSPAPDLPAAPGAMAKEIAPGGCSGLQQLHHLPVHPLAGQEAGDEEQDPEVVPQVVLAVVDGGLA